MPIYEYTCQKCNEVFSALQSITNYTPQKCPKCGNTDVKKQISAFSCCSVGSSFLGTSAPSYSKFSGG